VVQLFADDTTAYLSEHDSFDDLKRILDKWCLALGAHFNVTKTELIPFGTPEFCARLIEPDSSAQMMTQSRPMSISLTRERLSVF
jgi:hypothetical protein